MRPDPLRTMLRIRQSALDEAQKAVADAYQAEQGACLQAEQAAHALEHEAQTATSLAAGDDAVESFARWLPIGRRTLEQAHQSQRDATTELDRVRAVLALARSGVRAVEILIEKRDHDALLEEARRDQRTLDEFASRLTLT